MTKNNKKLKEQIEAITKENDVLKGELKNKDKENDVLKNCTHMLLCGKMVTYPKKVQGQGASPKEKAK